MNMTEVKSNVPITEVLDHYQVKLQRKGAELVGLCPFCRSQGFKANTERNCWKCFSCKDGGNILDFVAKKELCTVHQAAGVIATWNQTNTPLALTLKLDPSKTPFKEDTAKYFEAGYCNKGMHVGRVAIPIHNVKGELVAYVGKGEEDKYPKNYVQGIEVYNLHRIKGKHVYVCKDYYDVWKHHEEDREAVAVGDTLNAVQLASLASKVKGILLDGVEADLQAVCAILWVRFA